MATQQLDPFFLPALQITADGREWFHSDYCRELFTRIQQDVTIRQPQWLVISHPQFQRVAALASAALVKAGLLQASQAGSLQITSRGTALLHSQPERITFQQLCLLAGGNPDAQQTAAGGPGMVDVFVDGLFDCAGWSWQSLVVEGVFGLSWKALESAISSIDL